MPRVFLMSILAALSAAVPSAAHPVPSFAYDRVIAVQLREDGVLVSYRLNVDEITIFRDVTRLLDDGERSKLRNGNDIRDAFVRTIAPLIADRLEASIGGRPLTFTVKSTGWGIEDHVRCDLVFQAPWPAVPAAGIEFQFVETNFEQQKGQIDLSLAPEHDFVLDSVKQPDSLLKLKPNIDLDQVEEVRLREIKATLGRMENGAVEAVAGSLETPPLSLWSRVRQRGPVALLDSQMGMALLMLFTAVFGAAHALTPGHGKTLVAAYLVGERGTIRHAIVLGLVTTLTHTGMVLIFAVVLWLSVGVSPKLVQTWLGFVGGFLIAGMGLWLLLRRLAGQADHVHLGGHHHHHHHGDGHHHHHAPIPEGSTVRWWNLILLGVTGGLVPCWDAITLQLAVTAKGQLWLGPPLVLAFSTGLAATLVMIGIAVVKLRGFGASRWGSGRVTRALPIVSAVAIVVIGVWLCFDSLSS